MRLAVPFDPETGMLTLNLGDAENVRIYTEDDTVVFADDVESPAGGELNMIQFLADHDVQIVLCGDLSEDGRDAMFERRMAVLPGLMGPADELVIALLENRLRFGGADEGGCGCGCSCGDDCGGGCGDGGEGGCGCGCGC